MKSKALFFVTVLVFAVPFALAQGHGGQRGGPGRMQQGPAQTQRQGRAGGEMGKGKMDGDRLRIHATDQQRDQYRTCTQSMDGARDRVRQMARDAEGKGFQVDQARRQRDQLREQIQTMQQEHERLMQGLSPVQHEAVQTHIRNMNRIQERLHGQLQAMNQGLGQAQPDPKRVAEQARALEREMKQWQKQQREMGQELGLQP